MADFQLPLLPLPHVNFIFFPLLKVQTNSLEGNIILNNGRLCPVL